MGLIELIVTVCALSLPSQCEDQHFSFLADISLNQCVTSAPPYIAQWINEHPNGLAYGGGATMAAPRRKSNSSPKAGVGCYRALKLSRVAMAPVCSHRTSRILVEQLND
jgi:hypothetical protein